MGIWITLLLGIFIIIGSALRKLSANQDFIEHLAVSIAFGSMIALAVFDLIGETIEYLHNDLFILIGGIAGGVIVLKALDGFVPEHDHHHGLDHDCSKENVSHIGVVATMAVVIHNIVEGMAVYSVITNDIKSGLIMALSVGLHNLPMGLVIGSTLEYESAIKRNGLLCVACLSTFLGGLMTALLSQWMNDRFVGLLMAFALGMICYIVTFELAPHILHSKDRKTSVIGALSGFILVYLSTRM